MAKKYETESNLADMIGPGTAIKGDIETNNDIKVDGSIEGNLISKGRIIIGQSGKVIGELKSTNCDIMGTFEGKLTVSELLSLKASSKLHGDVKTSKLSIEPGAIFTGTCNMDDKVTQPSAGVANAKK
ncbi:MAG: polymer-forming cytoskeletal protein [Carboxylicivirga sp.]|jgi:cytoskeletal protein CcmA (bactofilin family)|nr:polymer-forming cytoskeletal protein [Carboxylicivirga sp.]MCT4647679.1 polymer-forming cytoskeletal protein [Carboxylicivirga sp.]